MNAAVLCLVLSAVAVPAHAQMTWTDKGFVNGNLGIQLGSSDLSVTTPFEIYGETGTVTSTQEAKGGGFFDVSAGYKVWRNLAVGIGFTFTDGKSDSPIAASVPNPLFFDQHRAVTSIASNVSHKETAINFTGTWMVPVTDKMDVGVAFGPTLFMVSQDVPNGVTVTEPGPSVSSVTVESLDESAVGFHLGIDVNYMLTKRWGVGGLARYSMGSVDIANADDSLKVGGLQLGAGVRVRF